MFLIFTQSGLARRPPAYLGDVRLVNYIVALYLPFTGIVRSPVGCILSLPEGYDYITEEGLMRFVSGRKIHLRLDRRIACPWRLGHFTTGEPTCFGNVGPAVLRRASFQEGLIKNSGRSHYPLT